VLFRRHYCHCEEGVLPDAAISCYEEIASAKTASQ
jgi:hypothetical protein